MGPCRRVYLGDDRLVIPHSACRHTLRPTHITHVTGRFSRQITGRPGVDFQSNRCCIVSKRGAVTTQGFLGNNSSLRVHYGICFGVARRRRTLLFTRRANVSRQLDTKRGLHTLVFTNRPTTITFRRTARLTNIRLSFRRNQNGRQVDYVTATCRRFVQLNPRLCVRSLSVLLGT